MTPVADPRRARLQELLGTEATQALSAAEAAELESLLAQYPDEEADGLALAAAAVHLALAGRPEEMPAELAERLDRRAVAFAPAATHKPARAGVRRGRAAWAQWGGWAVAAGLLGVAVWALAAKPKVVEKPVEVVKIVEVPKEPPPPVPLAKQREEFVAKARPETFAGDKKPVRGNIVWSDQEQVGYMEVRGLPPLDPGQGTYQLWIVDAERKDSPPVDGGVFKVNADGTALVPIRPPIRVKSAAAFAITREKDSGGVVVSKVPPEKYELVLTRG
jgi:hypothetical protein